MDTMEPIINLADIVTARRSKSKCSPRSSRSSNNSPRSRKKPLLTKENLSKHNQEINWIQESELQAENGKCDVDFDNIKTPRRRNEVHIEYRKCKQRKCNVCKPTPMNYHSVHEAVDPILFTRWEKKTDSNRTTLVKVNYVVNGLGQVIRNVDKTAEGKVKEGADVIKSKVRVRLDTLKGQRVIARKDQDGLYYPAVVLKCSDPRHARVRYDGNEEAQILTRNVIPVGGAVARPPLYVGDYVLIRVVYLDTKDECYVPAVIQAEPQRASASQKFYSVLMYNGQKATTMRKYLVKISKERFELASMYIAEQQNEDREEAQDLLYVSPRATNKRKKTRPDDKRKHQRKRSPLSVSSKASSEEKDVIEEVSEVDEDNYQARRKSEKQGSSQKIKRHKKHDSSNSRSRSRSKSPHEKQRHRSNSSKSRSRSRSDSRPRKNSKSKSRSRSRSRSQSTQSSKSSRSRSSSHSSQSSHSSRSSRPQTREKKTKKSVKKDASSDREKNQPDRNEGDGFDNFFDDDRSSSPDKNKIVANEKSNDDESDELSESHDDKGESSKERQLEKLQQKLLLQQKKQERQKMKLKKKAKRLARQRKTFKKSFLKEMSDGEPAKDGDNAALVEGEDSSPADPSLIELRKQLEHLRPGEEALARWSDDGWYYRGIIRQYHGDYSYDVEDSTGFIERIWREDLISENDASDKVFQLDDKAIALHPDYSFSYAPGLVISVNESDLDILFYDGRSASLPWGEVYHYHPAKLSKKDEAAVSIPQATTESTVEPVRSGGGSAKYRQDVAYITAREEKLVGAAVVAREDRTGAYYPGTVKKRSSDKSCSYLVGWADGSDSQQEAIHIFSAYTRRPNLSIGDRVLACVDPVHVKFLPGHLAGPGRNGKLVVKFCNLETRDDVDPALCYWLGQQYYDAAVKYFKTHDPSYS